MRSNDDGFKMVKTGRTDRRSDKSSSNESKNLLKKLCDPGNRIQVMIDKTMRVLRDKLINKGNKERSDQQEIIFHEVIIYGIGSFTTCPDARSQMSFILGLLKSISYTKISLYDPVLMPEDYELVKTHFNIERIDYNEYCRRAVSPEDGMTTLFFMPHMDKSFYNNLLWANWPASEVVSEPGNKCPNETNSNLNNTVILGNSFAHMKDTVPDRLFEQEYQYIYHVIESGVVRESLLDFIDPFDCAFNDFALMTFDTKGKEKAMIAVYSKDYPVYRMQEESIPQENT